MMVDESVPGATKLMVGESFVDVDSAAADEHLKKELEAARAARSKAEGDIKAIEARQGELKKVLYARFGKSINLEE